MSYVYVTKEKYNKFLEMMDNRSLPSEYKSVMIEIFQESLDYDPKKSTYIVENYKKSKEYHLNKSNGERTYSENHRKAVSRYKEKNREEINRKARERYHQKKERMMKSESCHVELTAFV